MSVGDSSVKDRGSDNSVRAEVPRQLPLSIREFTGRADQLAALDKLIDQGPDAGTSKAVVISAVDGAAGIGKTALAVHWAHRVQHRFADGTLYMNLRGYGPGEPAPPAEVLDGFLRALGVRADAMPQNVDALSARYRSLLAGLQMLIVLDNANGAEQVRPLLPGTAGCVVVVTSRDSLTGLVVTESATRLTLDLLSPGESVALVQEIIDSQRGVAEPAAVRELIRLCARLPLALRIAASRVSAATATTVADVVAELTDDRYRLDALSWDKDDRAKIRSVFDWSYKRLPIDEARLFRRLGQHVGPDFSLHAAAAIAGLDLPGTRRLLQHLTSVHMIESGSGDRYRFHDLLHAYAAEKARQHANSAERDQVVEALTSWYADTARICDGLVFPGFSRLPNRPRVSPITPVFAGRTPALIWLETERNNLLAALHQAASHELNALAVSITDSIGFLSARGHRREWLDAVRIGLSAAQRCGDHRAECLFRICQGEGLMFLQRWDDAVAAYRAGVAIACELDDRLYEAFGLNGLGLLFHRRQLFQESLHYLQKALPLVLGSDSGRLEAVVLGNLSTAFHGLGDYQQALTCGERDLAIRRRVGDTDGEVGGLHKIGRAKQGLGEHEQAIELCRDAIHLGRRFDMNLDLNVAEPLDTLAQSLRHMGHAAEAIDSWSEAVVIFTEYGELGRAAEIRTQIELLQSSTGPT
ncbi:tetratricopeptide repeat protein [Amycolatopsis sp. NPDC051371]|uniref:ATP-binding protein n=1 Tax=Amycolatopsis sp. NPDC051371 TaxID=3155800 RepID=UPI003438988B